MKGRSASKIKLTSYDELLGGGEETNDIQQVSLEHLHSFENHPFQVNDDEAMAELVESVKEEGILTALLVRPLGDGEYEIIAGHRRRHAAQLAGLKEVPVIIRNMDQDTAVRAMVDSNLQRPNILPSEKAFAYRMKMEAMNHQGTSGGISAKDIGKNANDSARQVYRYIRLTYLMNDLLNAVDRDVIGLQVGVELSYLTVPEQEMVEEVHESTGKYPSLEQAKKIRQQYLYGQNDFQLKIHRDPERYLSFYFLLRQQMYRQKSDCRLFLKLPERLWHIKVRHCCLLQYRFYGRLHLIWKMQCQAVKNLFQ